MQTSVRQIEPQDVARQHNRESNYRARGLYDKYTPHSGFLRYVITNPEA